MKKSVFLFWLLNIMALRCEHAYRLELRLLIFGLLWQRSKCAESSIYQ